MKQTLDGLKDWHGYEVSVAETTFEADIRWIESQSKNTFFHLGFPCLKQTLDGLKEILFIKIFSQKTSLKQTLDGLKGECHWSKWIAFKLFEADIRWIERKITAEKIP